MKRTWICPQKFAESIRSDIARGGFKALLIRFGKKAVRVAQKYMLADARTTTPTVNEAKLMLEALSTEPTKVPKTKKKSAAQNVLPLSLA